MHDEWMGQFSYSFGTSSMIIGISVGSGEVHCHRRCNQQLNLSFHPRAVITQILKTRISPIGKEKAHIQIHQNLTAALPALATE